MLQCWQRRMTHRQWIVVVVGVEKCCHSRHWKRWAPWASCWPALCPQLYTRLCLNGETVPCCLNATPLRGSNLFRASDIDALKNSCYREEDMWWRNGKWGSGVRGDAPKLTSEVHHWVKKVMAGWRMMLKLKLLSHGGSIDTWAPNWRLMASTF